MKHPVWNTEIPLWPGINRSCHSQGQEGGKVKIKIKKQHDKKPSFYTFYAIYFHKKRYIKPGFSPPPPKFKLAPSLPTSPMPQPWRVLGRQVKLVVPSILELGTVCSVLVLPCLGCYLSYANSRRRNEFPRWITQSPTP